MDLYYQFDGTGSAAGARPLLRTEGLEVDGGLRLFRRPGAPVRIDRAGAASTPFNGPAGIAGTAAGRIYLTDPEGRRVLVLDAADGRPEQLWPRPEGVEPDAPGSPRDVLLTRRGLLLVADPERGRVWVLHPGTRQVVGVWDRASGLAHPEALGEDGAGRVYVLDSGRIVRLSPDGEWDPSFPFGSAEGVRAFAVVRNAQGAESAEFLADIREATPGQWVLHWRDLSRQAHTASAFPLRFDSAPRIVSGLAIRLRTAAPRCGTRRAELFVTAGGELWSGRFPAVESSEPVTLTKVPLPEPLRGMTFDPRDCNRLLVRTGSRAVFGLELDGAGVEQGRFLLGPFLPDAFPVVWHSLRADADALEGGSRVRFVAMATSAKCAEEMREQIVRGLDWRKFGPESPAWFTESVERRDQDTEADQEKPARIAGAGGARRTPNPTVANWRVRSRPNPRRRRRCPLRAGGVRRPTT